MQHIDWSYILLDAKIGYFIDVFPSQSCGMEPNKLDLTLFVVG